MAYPTEAKLRKAGSLSISAVTIYDELQRKINMIAILVDFIVFSTIFFSPLKALWYEKKTQDRLHLLCLYANITLATRFER